MEARKSTRESRARSGDWAGSETGLVLETGRVPLAELRPRPARLASRLPQE